MKGPGIAMLASAVMLYWCGAAQAYRPFDGTDAAVAEPGEIEIELGPAEYLREGSERTLFAPSARFNYGVAPGWEGVIEGEVAHGLTAGTRGTSLVGNGAFLKGMLREGSLQEKPGPSIATEFGMLLPGIHDERGTGASVAGIVSQRWEWVTLHLNGVASVTRQQHADLFLGVIGEGLHDWPVRPVAEVFYERDFGRLETKSGLVGAIWQVHDALAVDVGLRGALVSAHTSGEIRAGLTVSFTAPGAGNGPLKLR
jgi:hypothetical protein